MGQEESKNDFSNDLSNQDNLEFVNMEFDQFNNIITPELESQIE